MLTEPRPSGSRCFLEFISQPELHHSGLLEQTGVLPESRGFRHIQAGGADIEARRIGNIKHFPAELHAVIFVVRHDEALCQTHVDAEQPIPSDSIALSYLAGITIVESGARQR